MVVSRNRRIYLSLRKAGFLPFEVKAIMSQKRITPSGDEIEVPPLSQYLNVSYIKNMIRARAKSHRVAVREGKLPNQYIDSIVKSYNDSGYLDREGFPDFWSMFRDVRQKAIDEGTYGEPRKRKRGQLDKGNIRAQRARHKQRMADKKLARERGYISIQRDADGNVIGGVVFNEDTGEFEVRKG